MAVNPCDDKSLFSAVEAQIEGYRPLAQLALNLRWSWNRAADGIWRALDAPLWEETRNPWVVLQAASLDKLRLLLADEAFRRQVDDLLLRQSQMATAPSWFGLQHPHSPLKAVAYFSMEYMLSEGLPIYSGGLGNVAGDQLKAAGDLGVPVVAIGLLYQQGYFRQIIAADGSQQAVYPYSDPGQLPITPLRQANGEWMRLEIALPGYSVWLRIWQAHVGCARLYLLDSNDPANYPTFRGVTSELYGGDTDLRLKQELLLGIGGWRLVVALGLDPQVCHLNEGHAAFAVLERARHFMQQHKVPFDVALAATRAGNLFTTHTAVAAGFDRFAPEIVARYLGFYAESRLGISMKQLLALGRRDPNDESEPFNMAYLAMRGSSSVNAVSRLHGEVSRRLFAPLFPRWPLTDVPVAHVTNGVHHPSWQSAAAETFWQELGVNVNESDADETSAAAIRKASDEKIWLLRSNGRGKLVEDARRRLSRNLAASGHCSAEVEAAGQVLDPNVLTLGFARRFASYKRPNLLLSNPQRLMALLDNAQRPVQIVVAGKAHPADTFGQQLVRQWVEFVRQPHVRLRAIFIADYDMVLAQRLVRGVDVWINTPRRPWEASGTSGMKVLANGGLNLSELDGWWAEAYAPEIGWAVGDGREHGDDPAWDMAEAEQLYQTLEQHVIPEFYNRNAQGIPTAWVQRIRESMARLTLQFSATRAVRQYTQQHYLPLAQRYLKRTAEHGRLAAELIQRQHQLEAQWPLVRFGRFDAQTQHNELVFDVHAYMGELPPAELMVELYADGVAGGPPERHEFSLAYALGGAAGGYAYQCRIAASRPIGDYTARIMPRSDGLLVPLEAAPIVWQR
ncbi:MAG: alpha-glucan family phosphorylase [Phycisphaerales bacterium]|nr:alpha-glucan family phosphorylase [Phycisphaerales bacterium]